MKTMCPLGYDHNGDKLFQVLGEYPTNFIHGF